MQIVEIIKNNFFLILKGLPMTLAIAICSLISGIILGFIFGFVKHYRVKLLYSIAILYVYIMRNIPVLMVIFVVYYSLPYIGINISAFATAVISLSLNQGAYITEIVRGGLSKLNKGQVEAGLSIGLTKRVLFQKIIAPQLIYNIGPTFVGQTIQLVKTTSIVSLIGLNELTRFGREATIRTHQPFVIFIIVGLIYFILCYALQLISNYSDEKIKKYIGNI